MSDKWDELAKQLIDMSYGMRPRDSIAALLRAELEQADKGEKCRGNECEHFGCEDCDSAREERELCPRCEGNGWATDDVDFHGHRYKCPTCKGTGYKPASDAPAAREVASDIVAKLLNDYDETPTREEFNYVVKAVEQYGRDYAASRIAAPKPDGRVQE